jgi:hypothetical protein
VDPGVHCSGVAVLSGGRLLRAALVEGPAGEQPLALDALLGEHAGARDGALVVEVPQVYQDRRGPNRRQDLVDLALVAGAWEGEAARRGWTADRVLPAAWKGQVPKGVVAERVRASLSPEERDALDADIARVRRTLRHNVLDAVAIALVHSGRLRMRARG